MIKKRFLRKKRHSKKKGVLIGKKLFSKEKLLLGKNLLKGNSLSKKRHSSIIFKLLALGLLPLLILDVVLTSYSTKVLNDSIKNELENSLKFVTGSLVGTYNSMYPGDYSKNVSGGIYKGKQRISGEHRLVDSIKESSGFDCTVYFDGMRMVTSVMKENDYRAFATSVDESIRQYVEFEGNTYFSDSLVVEGIRYYAYYTPLYGDKDRIAGMVFAGKDYNEVQEQLKSKTMNIIVFSACIILVSGCVTVTISTKLSRRMKYAKHFLSDISEGNLSTSLSSKYLKSKDEIGQIFQKSYSLQQQLIEIVSQIKESTRELVDSSGTVASVSATTDQTLMEISDAMGEIATQVQTQANQTQTASDNITIIGNQVSNIMATMDELSNLTMTMSEAEKKSTEIFKQLNHSNDQTIVSIEKIAKQTETTNESAQNIKKAVELIRSIAEETDLLSLNASIEAARAGSAGLGFSVVAEHIRKLADQSRVYANEIETIIQQLLRESNTTVEIMKEVKTNVDHQQSCLQQTKENFQSISDGINITAHNVEGIRAKTNELNESQNAIVQVIDALNSLSQDSAAVTEETSASTQDLDATVNKLAESSESLKEIAYGLDKQLEVFKL